jgi:hypothetical protein
MQLSVVHGPWAIFTSAKNVHHNQAALWHDGTSFQADPKPSFQIPFSVERQ